MKNWHFCDLRLGLTTQVSIPGVRQMIVAYLGWISHMSKTSCMLSPHGCALGMGLVLWLTEEDRHTLAMHTAKWLKSSMEMLGYCDLAVLLWQKKGQCFGICFLNSQDKDGAFIPKCHNAFPEKTNHLSFIFHGRILELESKNREPGTNSQSIILNVVR